MPEYTEREARLRPMIEDDLGTVLAWRNHPNVRRFMLTQYEITLSEHTRWFAFATSQEGRCLMVFELGGVPSGFVHFSEAIIGGISDWGFYVAPDAPKGTGRKLGIASLEFVFKSIAVHKVCGQALDFNEASIRFHRMLGFTQEGTLREQHKIGAVYHDSICFGLLKSEWMEIHGEEHD